MASSVPVKRRRIDPSTLAAAKISEEQWTAMCERISDGYTLKKAQDAAGVTPYVFRNTIRDDLARRGQYLTAKEEVDNRLWPESLIEEICIRYSAGETIKDLAEDLVFDVPKFHALRIRDDYVAELFSRAGQVRVEMLVDEVIELSDDDRNDMGMDHKGGDKPNPAAVQRSKLQVDSRKWLASKVLKEVYGDSKTIDLTANVTINYAEKLEAARNRKEQAHKELAESVVSEQ